jgi:murein L,D-transpeptidase YafK
MPLPETSTGSAPKTPGQRPRWALPGLALASALALGLAGCASETPKPDAAYADRVVVTKSERKLQLLSKGEVVREYRVALGDAPTGHKLMEGDERTPEGDYLLDWRNPNSSYYKSIHISYPNSRDRMLAKTMGVQPGGMIMLHGQPNGIRSQAVRAEYARRDWTNGCIAVQDREMDEIWRMVRDGTPISIRR